MKRRRSVQGVAEVRREHKALLKKEADAAAKAGSCAEALKGYEETLKYGGPDAVLHSNCSLMLLKLEKPAEALVHANSAAELRPEWGKSHARRGAALEAAGYVLEAQRAFAKASTCKGGSGFADAAKKLKPAAALLRAARAAPRPDVPLLSDHALVALLRDGRVCPESGVDAHLLDRQRRLLRLMAVEAAIQATPVVQVCQGSREWISRVAEGLGAPILSSLLSGEERKVTFETICGKADIVIDPANTTVSFTQHPKRRPEEVAVFFAFQCGTKEWALAESEASSFFASSLSRHVWATWAPDACRFVTPARSIRSEMRSLSIYFLDGVITCGIRDAVPSFEAVPRAHFVANGYDC